MVVVLVDEALQDTKALLALTFFLLCILVAAWAVWAVWASSSCFGHQDAELQIPEVALQHLAGLQQGPGEQKEGRRQVEAVKLQEPKRVFPQKGRVRAHLRVLEQGFEVVVAALEKPRAHQSPQLRDAAAEHHGPEDRLIDGQAPRHLLILRWGPAPQRGLVGRRGPSRAGGPQLGRGALRDLRDEHVQ